jgi:hypothetical protein
MESQADCLALGMNGKARYFTNPDADEQKQSAQMRVATFDEMGDEVIGAGLNPEGGVVQPDAAPEVRPAAEHPAIRAHLIDADVVDSGGADSDGDDVDDGRPPRAPEQVVAPS